MRPERRTYQRLNVDLEVDLLVGGQNVKATAKNISCGGMFLPIRKPEVTEQKNLQVIVHLPDLNKPVVVVGEVARIEKNALLGRPEDGVAIKFNGLYDDNILAIDRFIKDKMH